MLCPVLCLRVNRAVVSAVPRPQGDYVWLDSGTGVPIGARVKESEKGKLQLVDDEGKVRLSVVTAMRS